ncbi:MAG: aminopeptidase [Bacteroidetes bacterium]|nr:aminopeptidase [Bacteroidota bacterium]
MKREGINNWVENLIGKLKKADSAKVNRTASAGTISELQIENREIFSCLAAYELSPLNPKVTDPVSAALCAEIFKAVPLYKRYEGESLQPYRELAENFSLLLKKEIGNTTELAALLHDFKRSQIANEIRTELHNEYRSPFLTDIIREIQPGFPEPLFRYGQYISDKELQLFDHLSHYDAEALTRMGKVIAEAFMHGFISQNRARRNRETVLCIYQTGQELLAQQVSHAFNAKGLRALFYHAGSYETFPQFVQDHRMDAQWYLTPDYIASFTDIFTYEAEIISESLLDVCGRAGIIQFGNIPDTPYSKAKESRSTHDGIGDHAVLQGLSEIEAVKRGVISNFIDPSDISFCKVAFPNTGLGTDFPAVFDLFMEINSMESAVYESYQQILINTLDKAKIVTVKGSGDNETDIQIAMQKIENPDKETNFLNCGGDLNIPHGEVFTTPQLQGTNGLLHFREIYVNGVQYKDLKLRFSDGYIDEWSCTNYIVPEDAENYIHETLLFPHETLTMGEFAIGTNTQAYRAVKEWELLPLLPILLIEKMGPHFAVGDPCYARGEDAEVYNLPDGKRVTAKQNERTANRETLKDNVYFNKHIDLTLPYEETALLSLIDETGQTQNIIENGLFCLDGLEELNKPLNALNQLKSDLNKTISK